MNKLGQQRYPVSIVTYRVQQVKDPRQQEHVADLQQFHALRCRFMFDRLALPIIVWLQIRVIQSLNYKTDKIKRLSILWDIVPTKKHCGMLSPARPIILAPDQLTTNPTYKLIKICIMLYKFITDCKLNGSLSAIILGPITLTKYRQPTSRRTIGTGEPNNGQSSFLGSTKTRFSYILETLLTNPITRQPNTNL